jgi:hypothetical protein
MPGLNKQGPDGSGAMAGRQQGMCKRTDDLSLRGQRNGEGRGMGGRCRGTYFQRPEAGVASGVEGSERFTQKNAEELVNLKAEYKKTQSMLATLMQKIEGLEGVGVAVEPAKTEDNG